jgi:hypothetical protein
MAEAPPPEFNKVRAFLSQKAKTAAKECTAGGIGILIVGLILVLASAAVIYLALLYGLNPFWQHPAWLRVILSLALVGLLFLGNTLVGGDEYQEYKLVLTPGDEGTPFQVPSTGLLGETTDTPYGFLKTITDLLCIGPRTVSSSFKKFRRAGRLKHLDLNGCAAVITVLLSNEGRVPFLKIVNAIEGLEPLRVFPQMGDIEGVLFLKKEPQGMSLTSDFREEYARSVHGK